VEACWAHNPEVRGSKPRSASQHLFFRQTHIIAYALFENEQAKTAHCKICIFVI